MPVTVDAAHREVAGLYNEHHRWLSAWLRFARMPLVDPASATDLRFGNLGGGESWRFGK